MYRAFAAILIAIALSACATRSSAAKAVTIDATSVESAEASYKVMMEARTPQDRQVLALAVLMLNLEGVGSAKEALASERGSIGPIRNKVAGFTADEIIARARQVQDPKMILTLPSGR